VTEYTDEERRVRRRHLAQQGITLAVQSRWEEAATANEQIVQLTPDDAEAYNRLGKAYTELGRISDARSAYETALRSDPANLIAQRNLERLSKISELEAGELRRRAGQKLDPRFFMEETGKTGHVTLQEPADAGTLATLTAGDQVILQEKDGHLVVAAMDDTYVGTVEPRLAARVLRLMHKGNEYQAGVVGVDNTVVRVIIRESRQDPQNAGRISFPAQGSADNLPRPYVREGLIRRSGDEEDDDEMDGELDADGDEEEEDSSDFGFHEGPLDEP
jgi:Tetratricopeptide repeat